MNVAKVIVDVPANQTDRLFDYLIPEDWKRSVEAGMRVIVPFGPRKVQAFVVEVTDRTQIEKLKEIDHILDPSPVLTKELVKLGFWLANETLCYAISAFQVMLPAAMKAKYKKQLQLIHGKSTSKEIVELFEGKQTIPWEQIEANKLLLQACQKELKEGNLELIYNVEDKGRKKRIRSIKPTRSDGELNNIINELSPQASKQREVLEYFIKHRETIPMQDLLKKLQTTDSPIKSLVKKGILKEEMVEVYRDPFANKDFQKTEPFPLTTEQQNVIKPILSSLEMVRHTTFLMYGVTGSGKTEVYLQSIDQVLKKGKEAIVLVPEISLTPMMVNRFKGRFGDEVAVLHSGLSMGEKYDEWRKIKRKEVKVVVGARSAIFAPFENIGIIIIDEEHETSYKQEENPKYHARDVAKYRGAYHSCPVILGSATPTLESFARAQKGVYQLLTMKERMNKGALPATKIVDMREELREGNRSMFSKVLFENMQERIRKGEQIVLFLNRRGFSTFVMCRSCGYTIECPHCDISLTYHKRDHLLKCHYCMYELNMPANCPECQSEHIRFFGTGTQKVEEELTKVLPEARVIRMDVDTTRRKGAHEKLLNAFGEKKADILLGTQMIAKGLDFPDVTLVGILAADSMLHLPDLRASEKTFQLLTQVSGRAGRHHLPGEVVIQTYSPEHYSIELASKHDFDSFYEQEMSHRRNFRYPPYYYLTLVTISHPDIMQTVSITEKIAKFLKTNLSDQAIILGPVVSPIARIKDRYRYQCMVKYRNEPNLGKIMQQIIDRYQKETAKGSLQIQIDRNPYLLM